MPAAGRPQDAIVNVRRHDTGTAESAAWGEASIEFLSDAAPWRTFRWRHGQRHFSGTYWSSTEGDHVIYESRLELSRLLYADFDASVSRIIAQPFIIRARVGRQERKHIPDYLLLTREGPVVVDVKPRSRLSRPEVSLSLSWTRQLVEQRGWRYEVWNEPPDVELANVRFLAGYRNKRCFAQALLDELRADDLAGQSLSEACRSRTGWSASLVRSALFHLVWTHRFTIDLTRPLSAALVLGFGASS